MFDIDTLKFKYEGLLYTLNLYKVPAKEHQVDDRWVADEISVLEILLWKYVENVPLILHNYQKLKITNIVRFTISAFLSAQ